MACPFHSNPLPFTSLTTTPMDAHELNTRKIRLSVLRASQLPIHQVRWKPPKCFYSLSVENSLPIKVSKLAESWNPTWDEGLEIEPLSVVRLAIYRRSLLQPQIFLGEVVLDIEDLIQGRSDLSDHELSKRGSTRHGRYGKVTILLQHLIGPPVSFTPFGGLTLSPGLFQETENDTAAGNIIQNTLNLLNTQVTQYNTTLPSSDNFYKVVGYVERLVQAGDTITKVNPWANLAWGILSAIPKSLIAQLDRDQRMQQLWAAAADMLDFLKDSGAVLELIPVPLVDDMMKQIYDCSLFVREYAGRGFIKRALQDNLNSSCDRIVSQYIDTLRALKEQFMSRSSIGTFNVCHDIKFGVHRLRDVLDDIKEAEQSKLLHGLSGTNIPGARCDESYICLPDTRVSLLNDIARWIHDPDDARIFWLHGVAGSGKSTIANTIAARFTQVGRLGASFRFSHAVDGLNNPAFALGNIAYQLAHNNRQYKSALLHTIKEYGAMSTYSGLKEQLRKYIIEPLSHLEYSGPLVIVLDALDEIEIGSVREELLEALTIGASALPAYIRLLLVSRDEIDIRGFLAPRSHLQSMNDVFETDNDILIFIAHELSKVRQRHIHLALEWPGPDAMGELGRCANGLFIWAAVACDYIKRSLDPDVSLRHLLAVGELNSHKPRAESKLDQLYIDLLRRAMADYPLPETTAIFQYVVGSVIAMKTPLTRTALDKLLGLGRQETKI
ncbi:hypothetical protein BDZ94DRAFT_921432 [Collybia nuda]|uniref:C2 domain-containing protein n=1 Tax=Collybia nuda TaxID=64659 RepID=A0A9P5YDH1_9AGAR|nr:hypothetical protein BDZ94DRAFT_921432 [Collybia nuda]